jgi:hypothetical protein
MLKVRTTAVVGGRSSQTVALFSLVLIERGEGHPLEGMPSLLNELFNF